MSRRRIAPLLLLTSLALSASAERPRAIELPVAEPLELRALFDLAPGVISDDENGITVSAFAVEMVVARIGPDGKLVKACVDSEAEARRFLEAPIEKLQPKQGSEQ